MPLYKRYGKRKKKYVKRKVATVKTVKRMINKNQEKKFYDLVIDDTTSSSGSILSLTDIAQGDTDFTRDGDQLNVKYWNFRYQMTGADNTNCYRIIIFRWNVPTTYRVPVVTDILNIAGLPVTAIPNAQYVFDNKRQKQFSVLYDKIVGVAAAGPGIITKATKSYLNGLPISYSSSGTDGEGKLFMLLISDSSAAAHPRLSGVFRTIYTDS